MDENSADLRENGENPFDPNDILNGNSGLSDALAKLLGNKELMQTISSVVKGESPPSSDGAGTGAAADASGGENKANTFEGMTALPEMLAALKPILNSGKLSGLSKFFANDNHRDSAKRTALLSALKPYLCKERCEIIDYIISINKFGDIIKNINLTGGK